MVQLFKFFNYLSIKNNILLLNKSIIKKDYFFLILPGCTMKTIRLNYLLKTHLYKYGLKVYFMNSVNNPSFNLKLFYKFNSLILIYTKNLLKFFSFFKKMFLFFSQQQKYIFKDGIYVKFTSNFFDYKKFYNFLQSFNLIHVKQYLNNLFNYFLIYIFNNILMKKYIIFILISLYFRFWFLLKYNILKYFLLLKH